MRCQFVEKVYFLISRTKSLSLCERSVAHLPYALLALTFRHPCLPSPMGKEGSKAKLLKISRKADRDAPCDLAWGFAPKPHFIFTKKFIDSLQRL